ncbi:MAG: hypothetical protein EKK48_12155 [Candidatus Melainabacteria bacterium]|nr:MAG: hypothetical protein EKK48_12155 [Candidatus Melainabacteria bacterium]
MPNEEFPEIPDTDFSLAQQVRGTMKAFESIQETRKLTKEEWRALHALNTLWSTYSAERRTFILDLLKRGFAVAVSAILFSAPAFADDVPKELPINTPEPMTVVILKDEDRKPHTYKVVGLQKVTKQNFGFLRGRRVYHYKLDGTQTEYLRYSEIKNEDVPDLRPYEVAHPWRYRIKLVAKGAPAAANTAAWWASHTK